jgi:DNA-binding beta-propeller fold protein YncE
MTSHRTLLFGCLFASTAAIAASCLSESAGQGGQEPGTPEAAVAGDFEVWIADQSGTRPRDGSPADYGGWLHIFDGSDLAGEGTHQAEPSFSIDLGDAVSDLCMDATGRHPIRPHMIRFNDDGTHAVLAFVASGHVVVFDAETRSAINCIETEVSPSTGTRQAHAAFPAPDGSYILVANQNGKRLERIDADFQANTFTRNDAAALDLAGDCVTPTGAACEDDGLRPINWPICPVIASDSRHVFVTLRGGGMFVVDASETPMQIVAEYDQDTVKGNGCGGVEAGGHMFVNSGGSPVSVEDPHHRFGFDVYRFPLEGYSTANLQNHPAPELVLSKSGASDSHGMIATRDERYLWVMDRLQNVVEVIDVDAGTHVGTIDLVGSLSEAPAPDIADISPTGDRVFAALRGPVPLSGDPHNATGSTPGLGILQVTEGGRSGSLMAVVRLENPHRVGSQAPDPHGLQIRIRR